MEGAELSKHSDLLGRLRKAWSWSRDETSSAFLAPPQLVFAPPIRKESLQSGRGWLSRRTFTFSELFDAWGRADAT